MNSEGQFDLAVVDVETTGFDAFGSDRVVEIAIARFGQDGSLVDRYTTLINPQRDVGPTRIHGVRASDVIDAPTFSDVAGDVTSRISGTVIGGHNVTFDVRFLTAEYRRAGFELPVFPTICTLRLSHVLDLRLPNRKLGTCCEHFGISEGEAHTADADAVSAGRLLLQFLEMARSSGVSNLAELGVEPLPPPTSAAWPEVRPSGRVKLRSPAGSLVRSDASYVASLVARLPPGEAENAEVLSYLELLDRVLEDRLVTEDEVLALGVMAEQWGLTGPQAMRAHAMYFSQLVGVALSDGIISDSEHQDLDQVGLLLGLRPDETRAAIEFGSSRGRTADAIRHGNELAGKVVCFTGELECSINGAPPTRERAIEMAQAAGLQVADNVTKKLDLLVVADPNTQSGKAKKARQYGTRIMAESVFWATLGIDTDG